jgi:NAD(P)-dependent dehydrogenase (short-subunit alcohol dehydrogenase family)
MPVADPFDLSGRAAVVTGGNAGIGLGIARALAEAGADVAVWGRREQANERAALELEGSGRRALGVTCDVSDERSVARALAETVKSLGRLDACFANAGVAARPFRSEELPGAEWSRVLAVDLDGVMHALRAAAREMVARGSGGSLVAVSSAAAYYGYPRHLPYTAAKAAVPGVVRTLAVELAPHGIRANTLLPGWFDTEMIGEVTSSSAASEAVLRRIPMRRWGEPADLGGIAVYLASDASRYHTGDELRIDGGYAIY